MTLYPLTLFLNLLLGVSAALVFGLVALQLARRWGLMDIPGVLPHKQHAHPTPLAGGLTLALALLLGLACNPSVAVTFWQVWPGLLVVFAFGLWDDARRLSPRVKLVGQLLAALLLLGLGVSVRIFKPGDVGLGGSTLLNGVLTLLWVVGLTNAFNLIDSMDGLVAGISAVALGFMLLVVLSAGNEPLLRLLALLLGITLGLYFYNLSPARLFLGDSGAQSLGYLLAVLGLLFTPGGRPQASSWFVPVLILSVPIFDTTLVVISRLRRGLSPFQAGRDHTFHRLTQAGLEPPRAVAVLHLAAVINGSLAFVAFLLPPLPANLLFLGLALTGLLLLIWLESRYDC